MAQWPHPGDFEAAARRGGTAFANAGWPHPDPPQIAVPDGGWLAMAGTPTYPHHLSATQSPPLMLFGFGDVRVLSHPGLAVVGTREVTAYGTAVAQTAVRALPSPYSVVSGLARGADAVAHEAALEAGVPTVAVLPTGPDNIYPPENADLARRIISAGGAVISEQPFGTTVDSAPQRKPAPLPGRLMARNRIIAGLAGVLVLAEARGRSGSMHTVWSMLAMGRQVLVAPPKSHARSLPGAQAPLALAEDRVRTASELAAMGAPAGVVERWANRGRLANAVADSREELELLIRVTTALVATDPHAA